MSSNSLEALNGTNRVITIDDISDSLIVGRSEEHTACWKCLQMGSYDSALEYAEEIIKREPHKTDGYVFKSRALFKTGGFRESEETLLEAMKIAEQNDLILTDIEAFIKLKYELASIRKEILKSLDVINVKDVLKRHLNDLETSIVDLHLFSGSSKSSTSEKSSVVESDVVIKSEVNDSEALEVKPILRDCDQNSDSYETYNSSEEYDSCRTPLYSNFGPEDVDERVVTISITEYLRLKESDKKCLELEQKVHNLEEELKHLYFSTLNVAIAKKKTDREVNTLRSELDRMSNTIKYVEDREEEHINSKYYGIHESKTLSKKTSKIDDKPKMISIKKIDIKPIDAKNEALNTQTSIRNIYHNNKGVPKVDY